MCARNAVRFAIWDECMTSRVKDRFVFATVLGLSAFNFSSAEEAAFRHADSYVQVSPLSKPQGDVGKGVLHASTDAEPYSLPTHADHVSNDEVDEYLTRLGIGHDVGSGIGYENSFTTFEWMIPLFEERDQSLVFADLRMLLNNEASVGANVGLGRRVYSSDWNRTFGSFIFYDFRDTGENRFHQLGLGFETLGENWDFRANVYIPNIADVHRPLADRFGGNFLFIDRAEAAMMGQDMELGVPLLAWENVETRLFGGFYRFQASGTPDVWGWRTRAEVHVMNSVSVDVSVQDDEEFGTTVNLGVVVRFLQKFRPVKPQPPYAPIYSFRRHDEPVDCLPVWRRLAEPVERLQNIVITEQETIARDPLTASPLLFLHVAPDGSGNGSFEDPYATFAGALADPRAPTGIIYTPKGGTFTEDVNLVAGATLLSNGPVQIVPTQLGRQRLPFSGTSPDLTDLPQINGNLVLASNTTVSGFDVVGGVTGSSIGNVTLTESRVTNSPGNGITLSDVSGTVNLSELTVENSGATGLEVTTINDDLSLSLEDVTVSGAAASGIDLNVGGTGDLTATFSGVTNVSSTGNAFNATTTGAGDLVLSLSGATVSSTAGAGINIDGSGGAGIVTITALADNTLTQAGAGGILIDTVTFDSDLTTAGHQQVNAGNTTIGDSADTSAVTGDGLRLIDPTGDLSFAVLDVFNDSGTGLLVDTKTGGTTFSLTAGAESTINTSNGSAMNLDPLTVSLSFDTVTSTDSADTGITLDTVDGTLTIGETTVTDSAGTGILVADTSAAGLTADFGATTISRTHDVVALPAADALVLAENETATITFGSLDVTNFNGGGLVVDNSGTVSVSGDGGSGSTITARNGAAVIIVDTDVTMNFDSLNSDGGSFGVNLTQATGSFTVSGDPALPNSGGLINHLAGSGVSIVDSSAGISLNSMSIISAGTADTGISIVDTNVVGNPSDVTVTNTALSGTAADWIGIQVDSENGGEFSFTDVSIGGTTGADQQGIAFEVDGTGVAAPNASLAIDNTAITLSGGGAAATGVSLSAVNGGTINPLSGENNAATVSGGSIFDANGTDANISGTLSINGVHVFP